MSRILVLGFAGALAASLAIAAPASAATIIFSDNFNRADSNTVGNGWVEAGEGNSPGIVRIQDNELRMGNVSNSQNSQITQGTMVLSSIALTNITFSFDMIGVGTDGADHLEVFWGANTTNPGNLLANILLTDITDPLNHYEFSLGVTANNVADLAIRFVFAADQGNEVRIDNVLVQGVPEPMTIGLLGAGLLGLGYTATRRRRS